MFRSLSLISLGVFKINDVDIKAKILLYTCRFIFECYRQDHEENENVVLHYIYVKKLIITNDLFLLSSQISVSNYSL